MNESEALQRFGMPASVVDRHEIARALAAQLVIDEHDSESGAAIRVYCAQLFSIGEVEDVLLIWRAKRSTFDRMASIDVQFLCGAGLETTKAFLGTNTQEAAAVALEYLAHCEQCGDFEGFTPEAWLLDVREYYGVK